MIHVPYWWHATLLEVLWLAGGAVAACITTLNLRDAWKDNKVLDLARDDEAIHESHYAMIAISAHGRLNSQMFRLIVSGLIVFAGAVGVFSANPLGGRTTFTGLTVTLALVGISLMTATISLLDHIRRGRLYELAKTRSDVIAAGLIARHLTEKETS